MLKMILTAAAVDATAIGMAYVAIKAHARHLDRKAHR